MDYISTAPNEPDTQWAFPKLDSNENFRREKRSETRSNLPLLDKPRYWHGICWCHSSNKSEYRPVRSKRNKSFVVL